MAGSGRGGAPCAGEPWWDRQLLGGLGPAAAGYGAGGRWSAGWWKPRRGHDAVGRLRRALCAKPAMGAGVVVGVGWVGGGRGGERHARPRAGIAGAPSGRVNVIPLVYGCGGGRTWDRPAGPAARGRPWVGPPSTTMLADGPQPYGWTVAEGGERAEGGGGRAPPPPPHPTPRCPAARARGGAGSSI